MNLDVAPTLGGGAQFRLDRSVSVTGARDYERLADTLKGLHYIAF